MTSFEKKWIAKRLQIYKIKYAEIYDEVYDHMLSACEAKRQQGDVRPILSLFQETMDQDLGSHRGLERMTETRVEELNTVLKRRLRDGYRSFLSGGRLGIALAVWAAATFLLAQTQLMLKYSMFVVLILSVFPLLYMAVFGMKNRYLRTIRSRRKTSLVNNLMFGLLSWPLILMNGVIGLLNTSDFLRGSDTYVSYGFLLGHLGAVGMGLLWTVILIYCKIVYDILHTTYRGLMQHLSV